MAGDSGTRRVASLKTYSKRVNRSFPVPAGNKISERVFVDQTNLAEGAQRRVLPVEDENHSPKGNSEFLSRKQQVDKSASSTTTATSRQALVDIDPNYLNKSISISLFEQSQEGDSTALRKTQTNGPHTSNSSLSAPDKDIFQGGNEPSPGKTRQNTYANTPNSSHQATNETSILESVTQHLAKPSKKRRNPDESESKSEAPLAAKKVKRSSIKNYFKPAPASSSPSTSRSTKVFSDSLDAPSSPPTSPLSEGGSPKFQTSRKKIRRNLSLKPSLPSPVAPPPPATMFRGQHSKQIGEMIGVKFHRIFVDGKFVEVPELLQDDPNWTGVERGRMSVGCDAWSTQGFASSTSLEGSVLNESNSRDRVAASFKIDGGVSHSEPVNIPPRNQAPTQTTYHQLRFVTDHNPNILCDDCGFMFNRTIKSEVRDHSRWHRDHTRGNHPMKGLLSKPLWEEAIDEFIHRIQVNRRGASAKEREWYENALEISIRRGLDGPFTNDLWSDITDPSEPTSSRQVPKYKIYVYTIGVQVVSLILAERITKGGAYYVGPMTHDENGKLVTPDHTELQEYVNLDHSFPVMVSVDRVWTETQYRRKGYATKLLDYVRKDFITGIKLHKCQIAFSAPTTIGCAFATKYCGEAFADKTPFVVNVDDPRMVVENGKLRDKWAPLPEDFDWGASSEKKSAEQKWRGKGCNEKGWGEKSTEESYSDLFTGF